jgi:hypothetical protein
LPGKGRNDPKVNSTQQFYQKSRSEARVCFWIAVVAVSIRNRHVMDLILLPSSAVLLPWFFKAIETESMKTAHSYGDEVARVIMELEESQVLVHALARNDRPAQVLELERWSKQSQLRPRVGISNWDARQNGERWAGG